MSVARLLLLSLLVGCTSPPTDGPGAGADCDLPPLDELHSGGGPLVIEPWMQPPSCVDGGYDAIIILGCPSRDDGSPSDCQRARVRMATRLSEAGWAKRFIPTGAAVQNDFIEAESMASLLMDAGVDGADIFPEPLAEHTDENIYWSSLIMQEQGWSRALVVSDAFHLLLSASCDANCCVKLGRLTLMDFPADGGDIKGGDYLLAPAAELASSQECGYLVEQTSLCSNLPDRRACADDLQLRR